MSLPCPDTYANRFPHGCPTMLHALEDPRIPLNYDEICREYSIGLPDEPVMQVLAHCPFCAATLPMPLRDQLEDEMEALLGEDMVFTDLQRMPIEFRSDAWWQGRYDDTGQAIV